MTTEWMKVMLEEIERKKTEAEQARMEEERRLQERLRDATPAAPVSAGNPMNTAGAVRRAP
jgi:hypothetical protein